jgi:hypothetical protein
MHSSGSPPVTLRIWLFRVAASLGCAAALVAASRFSMHASGAPTIAADRVVDAFGVNIHLHHTDTLYANFDLVKSRLLELGTRHVRDGLIDTTWQPYYDRHNTLGRAGIKGIYITAPHIPLAVLRDYHRRVPEAFEGFEAPNEYDQSGDHEWVATLRATLTRMHELRADPEVSAFPIYGPALTQESSYVALGDVTGLIDFANLHNYPGGRHPGTGGWGDNGYGSIPWNLTLASHSASSKPVVTTETGYWDDMATPNAVPEAVVVRYMPRLLLEQFRRGITRTYLYELIDSPQVGVTADSGYGLLRRDGARKPAFMAVKNLLRMLSDPGPAVSVTPLDYTLTGGSADIREMAFQKRNGTYLLALWIESSGYDVNTRSLVTVPPETVTVTVNGNLTLARTHRWDSDGEVGASAVEGIRTTTLSLTDGLTILEIQPSQRPPAAPLNLRVLREP